MRPSHPAAIVAALTIVALLLTMQTARAQHQPLIKSGACGHGGYFPVCAVKQKTLVTYVNVCAARGVNAQVIATGRGCLEGCPTRYAPVCGTDRTGQPRLYGNACEAEKSGATDIRTGRCRIIRRGTSGADVGAAP